MKEDERLEQLGEQFLSNLPLETPSTDFSARVMQMVQAENNSSRFVYKPLITLWGWITIFILAGAVAGYSFFSGKTSMAMPEFSWFKGEIGNIATLFPNLQWPQMSEVLISAMLIFSFMALLEISLIKRFFDKKSAL